MDTARARAEAALRRDAALEAIAFAAQRFLETPDWASVAPQMLRRLGEAADVSRVYLFENVRGAGEPRTVNRSLWAAEGVATPVTPGAELGFEGLERWVTVLGRGDVIHGIVADLPESERDLLAPHDIRSILLVPVLVGGAWWGYLGFDDCARDREWTQIEIDTLRAAAGAVGAAIHRERSDERLREAEARFRSIVEHTPVITYQEPIDVGATAQGSIVYVSPQVERILGYPVERWMTPGFWPTLLHPEDADRVLEENDRVARTGEPYRQEYRMIAADGRTVWLRDEAILIRDERGRPHSWQGVLLDITERKEAEDRLREAEGRFRALVENIPAVTYRESVDGNPAEFYVSPQVEKLFGYTQSGWAWTPGFWRERIHPEDRERVVTLDHETNRSGRPYSVEYRFRRADGTYRWIHDQATLVREDDGPGFWQGFMLDVTERREAEQGLAEAEEKYRALVEQVPVVIYTQAIDPEDPSLTNTVYMSPRSEDVLGYTSEEMLESALLWRHIIHPDDRDAVISEDVAGNESGEDFSMEYRVLTKDGRVAWIHDEATVVRDAAGVPRFWQGFMLDVTERREAEERLERALDVEREASQRLRALDEMKNTFLQAVSHDLRTPLAAILGLAVTLERGDIDLPPDETRDLARRIATNARKLDRMVTDLLDLDRLARGIVEPKLHPTDVGSLVGRVVGESHLMAQGRVRLQAPPVTANVDASKVERIVENLLANTARHTPAGTTVWVSVERADGGVTIVVEDEGPGVPVEMREAIFEPFRQGPETPEHSPGVGVGLTLVARFAEMLGGRAWVEDREGGGASFRVFLADGPRTGAEVGTAG